MRNSPKDDRCLPVGYLASLYCKVEIGVASMAPNLTQTRQAFEAPCIGKQSQESGGFLILDAVIVSILQGNLFSRFQDPSFDCTLLKPWRKRF
jgi:hypothetical protein